MKLYAHPTTPKRNPFYSASATPTPASSYALECRMVAAYTQLLYRPGQDVEELMRRVWGSALTPAQMYGHACKQGRIDRLDYGMPELIRSLHPTEQAPLAELLLGESPDLVAAVQYLLSLERMLHRRLDEPCSRRLNDESYAKAAGLGRDHPLRTVGYLAAAPCACHQPDGVLSALVLTLPAPATAVRQPAPTNPPIAVRTAQTLLYRVKRAQERRRLKRKRR